MSKKEQAVEGEKELRYRECFENASGMAREWLGNDPGILGKRMQDGCRVNAERIV